MKISRKDLFYRIWTTPMSKLAAEFDISDVGLAKVCRKNQIPRPPVGYWAKVAAGKSLPRPALPGNADLMVTIDAARHRIAHLHHAEPTVNATPICVDVKPVGKELAPAAAATVKALTNAKPKDGGLLVCGSSRVFSCKVTEATIERVGRILDAIERALPTVGGALVHDRDARRLCVQVNGETLGLSLAEGYTRKEIPLLKPKDAWSKTAEFVYLYNGQLKLKLVGDYQGRNSWSDGKRAQLEDKLGDVLNGLVFAAAAIAELRERRASQKRMWEEEARQRAIANGQQRRIRWFLESLGEEAASWHEFNKVQAYVEHIAAQLGDSADLPESSRHWMRLAAHLSRQESPATARLRILRDGDVWHDYEMPFGSTIVG